MSGYYPPGCTEDIFDRETDRMNEEPEPRHTPEYPHDPQAFEKLRRSLEGTGPLTSRQRWSPKEGVCTLDGITPEKCPAFRYILTRNGHNVALYGGLTACEADMRDRAARFPMDDWTVIDRQDTRKALIMCPECNEAMGHKDQCSRA